MKVSRITQLLVVDAIEPVLAMWKGALGFAVLVEVPDGEHLGFALLASGDQHIMLQTKESLAKDVPTVAALGRESISYLDVDSLDDAAAAMKGAEILVPRRTTFYGAQEIFYRLASGHVVALAQHDR